MFTEFDFFSSWFFIEQSSLKKNVLTTKLLHYNVYTFYFSNKLKEMNTIQCIHSIFCLLLILFFTMNNFGIVLGHHTMSTVKICGFWSKISWGRLVWLGRDYWKCLWVTSAHTYSSELILCCVWDASLDFIFGGRKRQTSPSV